MPRHCSNRLHTNLPWPRIIAPFWPRHARRKRLVIMLAGRPYHTDPLIQHKVSDMVAAMGVYVITDDIVRSENISIADTIYLSQWAYPNRIMKAAKWVGAQGQDVQFMQLTSFGCGPDAFLVNEVRATLERYHKKTSRPLKSTTGKRWLDKSCACVRW